MTSVIVFVLIAISPIVVTSADDDTAVSDVPLTGTSGKIVDVSARGEYLWCIDSTRATYQFNYDSQSWTKQPTQGLDTNKKLYKISATNDGGAWLSAGWPQTNDHQIYRKPKNSQAWAIVNGAGTWVFPVSAITDNRAVGVGNWPRVHIYHYFPDQRNPDQINLGKNIDNANWVAMGEQDDTWYTDDKKNIYRFNQSTKNWDLMPGTGCTVDLQCPNRVVMTAPCGVSYMWNKDRWTKLPFGPVKFTTVNYNAVYVVTKDGKIQKYKPSADYDCPCLVCPAWEGV